MARQPAHRRKKDPLARQILGAYRPPPLPREAGHVFVPSGRRDVWRRRICATCDNVEPHRCHQVPDTLDDEGRRAG